MNHIAASNLPFQHKKSLASPQPPTSETASKVLKRDVLEADSGINGDRRVIPIYVIRL
jgi:hypothetical protein